MMLRSVTRLGVLTSLLCIAGGSVTQAAVVAEPLTGPMAEQTSVQIIEETRSRIAIGMGLSNGYVSSSAEDLGFKSRLDGFALHGELLGQLSHEKLSVDLGLGWYFQSLSGYEALRSAQISSRAGTLRFNPRYRINPRWEVGPSAMLLFGGGDLFRVGRGSEGGLPVMLGVVAAFQLTDSSLFSRAKLELATDVSIPGRQMLVASLGVDFALPVFEKITPRSQIVQRKVVQVQEVVNILLDSQVVHFEKSSADLTVDSKDFIAELGRFLNDHPTTWSTLRIEGHTDERGTESFNQILSEKRANSVRQELLAAGLSPLRIVAVGLGVSKPVKSGHEEGAWQKNRRVELALSGVTQTQWLRDEVQRIKFAHSVPVPGSSQRTDVQ